MNGKLLVLYKEGDTYHQILLNELELNKISSLIGEIFWAKKSDVLVSDTKLKVEEEGLDEKEKTNSRKVQ